eukprot:CAMPEP_0194069274 /NCGR_PEP_ID=MMETSP0009_2-20130614/87552_1 /TAXON_ID=210454 /ORGANISM="Grammatophora oceanica, Strain CCMP 410" /LENGTH=196 /DNA_ID=CAMNT_0038722449 /DNA_START=527 /DNA_END=1114 /DNA_ORIENTATION=+
MLCLKCWVLGHSMFEVLGSWTFNQRMMTGSCPTIDLGSTATPSSDSGAERKLIEMSTMEVTAPSIAKQDAILDDLMGQIQSCGNACSYCNGPKPRKVKQAGVKRALWHAMREGNVLLEDLPAKIKKATRIRDLFGNNSSSTREPELKEVKILVLQLLAAGILDTSFSVDQKGKVSVHCVTTVNKDCVPFHADQRYW